MDIGEIARSYRQAKDPDRQIKILSELTLKPIEEIEQILKNEGVYKEMVTWTKEKDAELTQLRNEKVTFRTIAEKFGTTEKAIKNRWYRIKKAQTEAEKIEPVETVTANASEPREIPQDIATWSDSDYPGLLRMWAEILYGNTYKQDKTANTARTLMRGAADRYETLLNNQPAQSDSNDSNVSNDGDDITALVSQILQSPVKANKRITLNADGTAKISIECIS